MSMECRRYFHRTTAHSALQIIRFGFRDSAGNFLTGNSYRGVFLSALPLDINEGAEGNTLLAVDIEPALVEPHEWKEEGKGYREYLVPASDLKQHGTLRVVDDRDGQLRQVPAGQEEPFIIGQLVFEAAEALEAGVKFAEYGDRLAALAEELMDAASVSPEG